MRVAGKVLRSSELSPNSITNAAAITRRPRVARCAHGECGPFSRQRLRWERAKLFCCRRQKAPQKSVRRSTTTTADEKRSVFEGQLVLRRKRITPARPAPTKIKAHVVGSGTSGTLVPGLNSRVSRTAKASPPTEIMIWSNTTPENP
jgi:hypothetical protein